MSTRRTTKSSSQSTTDKGVVPARGKEQEKRSTANAVAASPALAPAPTLAKTRAGTKTLESTIQKITGLRVTTETDPTSEEDRLLDEEAENATEAPMEIQRSITEKKSLLAWRQAYKKTRCNINRARSHLDFIRACMGNRKIPRGLQVKVQCNALLSELTDVKTKFECTRGMAEKEFIEALEDHYVKLLAQLERDLVDVEFHMAIEVRNASEEDRSSHELMMTKTRENIEKLDRTLEETKKRKMEMLSHPPEKRRRESRDSRKREYVEKGRRPRQDWPPPPPKHKAQTSRQGTSKQQPAPKAQSPYRPSPAGPSQPPQAQQSNNNTELSTIASLLNQLLEQGKAQQQPPTLLHPPCAVGLQPPPLLAPPVSVMPGQPPPLSGHYQQGFRR